MIIQHKMTDGKGIFYVDQDGAIVAELVYSEAPENKMIIEHTEVDDSLSGKGIGLQLVKTAIEYARGHQLKIEPLCSFARSIFKKKPEFGDVLFSGL
ncbi:MAG: GNAT family N-acetyltransferase [Chitinophagaceae bacterium]